MDSQISSESEYRAALAEAWVLMQSVADSPEAERLDALADKIVAYESKIEKVAILRFAVSEGRRNIEGAGPAMIQAIFDSIEKRINDVHGEPCLRCPINTPYGPAQCYACVEAQSDLRLIQDEKTMFNTWFDAEVGAGQFDAVDEDPAWSAWQEQYKRIRHLSAIIANLYQVAGASDAPAHVLDLLANPEQATAGDVDELLVWRPRAEW